MTRRVAEREAKGGNACATPINAALSERLSEDPARFYRHGLQSFSDLMGLAESLQAGDWKVAGGRGRSPFRRGCEVQLLGYSLGGYLSLILKLHPQSADLFGRSLLFCSGASGLGKPGWRADPVSDLILDLDASTRWREYFGQFEAGRSPYDTRRAALFHQVMLASTPEFRARLAEHRSEFLVIAGTADRVIPAAGIRSNLGFADHVLDLGIHEYPFNLAAYPAPGADRSMARAYDVAPEFDAVFVEFAELAVEFFGRERDRVRRSARLLTAAPRGIAPMPSSANPLSHLSERDRRFPVVPRFTRRNRS